MFYKSTPTLLSEKKSDYLSPPPLNPGVQKTHIYVEIQTASVTGR